MRIFPLIPAFVRRAIPSYRNGFFANTSEAETDMNKKIKEAQRDALVKYLDATLRIAAIQDSSCNGLQVQGAPVVRRIGLCVDACMDAYTMAAEAKCQMVIAHHGIIWKGIPSISGTVYTQIKYLMTNDINLYAAHLPLDLHPVYGNNAELAKMIGLTDIKPFGLYHGIAIGFEGVLTKETTLDRLSAGLAKELGSKIVELPFGKKKIKSIAIISGGAGEELGEAIEKKIDCYITGESVHQNHHQAKEAGINAIFCGHYESETLGVKAIGRLLEKKFGVETLFLDIPTIV
jgi:dinuclear metal center YbgI/SA1388 family protein